MIKQVPTQENLPDANYDKRLDTLSPALAQIMHTGLFQMEQDEDTEEMNLILNEDFLHQKIKALPSESSQEIEKLQLLTEQLEQKNQELAKKVEGILISNKENIAIKIREKHIDCSTQIEIEKKLYIAAYMEEHIPERLKKELHFYHDRLVVRN